MLNAGAVVGGYRIQRMLGAGGMGSVYLAANPTLPRYDALKVLSAELSRDADFRARFIREADVAAALDHPNIVSVYTRGQTERGELWIAMQFVDGTDADAALRAGTMTAPRAVHIVAEVAKALDYAHAHGVVHRDIKPANFMVAGQIGPEERVLLGDFGIARALDDVGLTATGSVLATVAYAAPEVLSGMQFDGRSDIYSLGCALFAMLTGRPPFPATNGPAAVMMAHLQQPPPRVTDFVASVPAALDGVIATAMAKDPAARFPSAAALGAAAHAALHDPDGVSGAPWWHYAGRSGPPTVSPAPPRRRRSRRTALLAVAAAAALLIGGSITAVALTRHGDAESSATADAAMPAAPIETAESRHVPRTAAADVPPTALRAILMPADQLPGHDGADAVVLEQDKDTWFDDPAVMDASQCAGAWVPAQEGTYAGSGSTGVAAQLLRGLNMRTSEDSVIQAVVSFSSRVPAVMSMQHQQDQWAACAGRPFTLTPTADAAQSWEFEQPRTVAGTVLLGAKRRDGTAVCQHGISLRGNVVIDIRQCRPQGGADVAALVNATANRVPQ